MNEEFKCKVANNIYKECIINGWSLFYAIKLSGISYQSFLKEKVTNPEFQVIHALYLERLKRSSWKMRRHRDLKDINAN